jgi:predicted DNA-binding transcriptional regulator AlpA
MLPEFGIHYHMNHLRRMWKRGDFPAPHHLSARKLAWKSADLIAWVASKTKGRA